MGGRVVKSRSRGKRSLQQRLVAEFNEGSATQANRFSQNRNGPAEPSWTRKMSIHFVAWERRRREPGSNSVIVTIALTRDEGHVVGLGGLQRVRKIFASCLASKPFRGQTPIHNQSRNVYRSQSADNRFALYYGQQNLCRFAAEAQIQDRSLAHPLSLDGRGLG